MVDFVEDDEGRIGAGPGRMHRRIRCDLRICDGDPVVVGTGSALRVCKGRVDVNADPGCGIRPLALQMLCRTHDRELVHDPRAHEFKRDPQSESCLPRSGGRDREEITRLLAHVLTQSRSLPGAQSALGASSGTL